MMLKAEAINPPVWPLQKTGYAVRLSNVVFALAALFM